jgi:hypothetical protein
MPTGTVLCFKKSSTALLVAETLIPDAFLVPYGFGGIFFKLIKLIIIINFNKLQI